MERLLRRARPAASEDLVRRLVAQATPMRRPQGRRFAMAGVATAVMLVGLAAIGGVGRAASELHHVVNVATGQTHTFGTHLAVQLDQQSAADGQYGPPPASAPPELITQQYVPAGSTTPIVVAGGAAATITSATPLIATVSSGLPGSLTSSASLTGAQNKFVTISLKDTNGSPVGTLVVPLSLTVPISSSSSSTGSDGLPKNYAVTFSSDGAHFDSIPACTGDTLAAGQTACYVLDDSNNDRSSAAGSAASGPSIRILSLKPGIFGLVYKANITQSESGRTVPQAGSGKFGDPTRNHIGAPVLKQVGSKITPATSLQSTKVPFDFSVDEQAAVYMSIYDAKGNPVMIRTTGTKIRGHAYSGKAVHTLHFVVLRPGQINTLLNVAPGTFKAGQTYKIRITAIDFDGHKVTEYTTFTG